MNLDPALKYRQESIYVAYCNYHFKFAVKEGSRDPQIRDFLYYSKGTLYDLDPKYHCFQVHKHVRRWFCQREKHSSKPQGRISWP